MGGSNQTQAKMMPGGRERDCALSTPQGQIPLRIWGGSGHGSSPIVLFNGLPNSVGSWGDLPSLLSRATGQMVVAFDWSAIERSDIPGALPWSRDGERRAARQIAIHPGFESFIACGHDGGAAIAAEAAAWAGPACLGVITIRGRAWAPEPLSNFSMGDAVSKLRCPVLALHGELDPVGHAGRRSAHGMSKGDMIAAIREFLALRVFPLPIY